MATDIEASAQEQAKLRFPELVAKVPPPEAASPPDVHAYLNDESQKWMDSVGHFPKDPTSSMAALGLESTPPTPPPGHESIPPQIIKARQRDSQVEQVGQYLKDLSQRLAAGDQSALGPADKYLAARLAQQQAVLSIAMDELDKPESGYAQTRKNIQADKGELAALQAPNATLQFPRAAQLLAAEVNNLETALTKQGVHVTNSLENIHRLSSLRVALKSPQP